MSRVVLVHKGNWMSAAADAAAQRGSIGTDWGADGAEAQLWRLAVPRGACAVLARRCSFVT